MGTFYLNALHKDRRYYLEFFFSVNKYVQEKDGGTVVENTGLPATVHPRFSPDVGDIVWYFQNVFRTESEFMQKVNAVVNALRTEQSTDIPETRLCVLREANKHVLIETEDPISNTTYKLGPSFRDFLLNFISQPDVLEKLEIPKDNLTASIYSPAILQFRQFLDFYAERFDLKDPKSYIKFYACVCTVLSEVEKFETRNNMLPLFGEVENVLYQRVANFPGYSNMDNAAKYEKLLVSYQAGNIEL